MADHLRDATKKMDFISREAAIETLSEYYHHRLEIQHIALREALNRVPAADVRPVVRGEWLEPDDDYGYIVCSVCEERSSNYIRWNFCPQCGADMRGYAHDE